MSGLEIVKHKQSLSKIRLTISNDQNLNLTSHLGLKCFPVDGMIFYWGHYVSIRAAGAFKLDDILEFDPAANSWKEAGKMMIDGPGICVQLV